MKKLISVALSALILLVCLLPAAAEPRADVISIRLNSDVAGCTDADVDRFIELRSPQVTFYESGQNGPISIANAAGGGEYAHLDRGRTYAITYTLTAAEGYTLPETLPDGCVQIECGKGVKVASVRIAEMYNGGGSRIRVLSIVATVVVDGNVFQRIVGWVRDLILKIRSWSLY